MTPPVSDTGPTASMPSWLEAVLACPADHSPLEYGQAAAVLTCTSCARAFRVEDGIPVLLLEEGTAV